MNKPFFLLVGQRYARAERKNHFISFISLTSMIGIALGVTVLITVLSVMNGFSKEIRAQMLSITPHVNLRTLDNDFVNWQPVLDTILADQDVLGAAPYVLSQGMLTFQSYVQPAIVRGIEPDHINDVYPLENNITAGSLSGLVPGSFSTVIGKELAQQLGVWVGDKVTLLAPDTTVTPAGIIPRLKRLTVIGVFDTGTHYDHRHAFINIEDAKKLFRTGDGITGIQIKVTDELESATVANRINAKLDFNYWVENWTTSYASFFDALKMEKTVMWCILLLIIAVAAFNLVSSLVMMVTDKRSDIAILRTMGAKPKEVMGIFVVQGAIIGVVGTIIGLVAGLLLANNITQIVEFVQSLFNIQFISEDVYLIGFVPSKIEQLDVSVICTSSLIMSLLATIYPAWRAANIQPAEALRYE